MTMSVTYYVALPFIHDDEGQFAAGQPQECLLESGACRTAEAMSRKPPHVGAVAFRRSGEPAQGSFGDATILKKFGVVPDRLDEF
jgi:hypothetical protein